MKFHDATKVAPVAAGHYRGRIHEGWDIGGKANGGYLIALGAKALAAASGRERPATMTAHYLAPGEAGPVGIDTEVIKAGKSYTTVRGTMTSGGRPILALLGSFTDLAGDGEPLLVDGAPPELPPIEDCRPLRHNPELGWPPRLMDRVELRLHPDDLPTPTGERSGHALIRGYFRLNDGEPNDHFTALLATDTFPPTIFNLNTAPTWVPTLELTVQVRATPAPGWLRCRLRTRFVTDGVLEEDGEIWDETGALVALSRQLALLPRPR